MLSKKNLLLLLLSVVLVLGALAGCGGSNADNSGSNNSQTSAPPANAANTGDKENTSADNAASDGSGLPIVKEPLELTYWVNLSSNVAATSKSYNEIAAYKETEKLTGIRIDFQHPATGQEKDQFNLMLASGKYPDMIEYNWLTKVAGGPAKALKDGVILRLNDLIDEHAPNLKKVLDENPEYKKLISTDEGDIYEFPFIRGDDYLLVSSGMGIRKDWLDKLKLEAPTTIDEWHTVLKAFKEQDPNGNGEKDEIPLLLSNSAIEIFSGAWGVTPFFYQVDGKVMYGAIQPEFKEALATLNQWYEEGLIDPDYVAVDSKLMDAKMIGDQLGSLQLSVGGGIGKYMDLMQDKNPAFSIAGAPYPVLSSGDTYKMGIKSPPFQGDGTAITKDNDHVVESVKWLDFKYSEQGKMLFNFGIEGESYAMENGYPTYTDLIMNNPDGLPVAQALAKYALATTVGPFVQDRRYMEQYAGRPEQKDAITNWMKQTEERRMPSITPTQEESDRISRLEGDIKTYHKEMAHKFIMGVEPIENFDKYVETLKKMGIDEYISVHQAALERYNNR